MLIILAESRHRRCKLLRHPAYAGLICLACGSASHRMILQADVLKCYLVSVTVCANTLLQGAVKRDAGSWRKRNIAIGIMLAPVRLLINVVLGAGKYLTGQSPCRQNGVSRSYTATLRKSPSDAGLFGRIRDLSHRRAFEAYDKAIRSFHSV
jgi:hypothetical protein